MTSLKPPLLTREELRRLQAEAKRVEARSYRLLAVVSVLGGVGQLLVIRWAERNLAHATEIKLTDSLFIAYILLLAAIFVRARKRIARVGYACPHCGQAFKGTPGSIAMATGRCGGCGEQVVG